MGKLIVIDGLDGSGKETQTNLLKERLEKAGKKVRVLSFPRYGEPSAAPVELYLSGALGAHPSDTNAYAASAFFSVDRYVSYVTDWKSCMEEPDTVVLANRYTTANAVHQLSTLPRDEWEGFLSWLWDFEFDKLGLTHPDLTIYLEMPPAVSHRLIEKRSMQSGRKMDIHETDSTHLEDSYRAALFASDRLGWNRICCAKDGEPLPIDVIGEEVFRCAEALL